MPLVLDDVLITSDDERAANILRALARFAEGRQVIVGTASAGKAGQPQKSAPPFGFK